MQYNNLNDFLNRSDNTVNSLLINNDEINVLSLNGCGLKRRSQYPEFIELVKNYDILCFVETKTDDMDEIDLPGYYVKMKNRSKISRVKSVGIILAYKEHLSEYICPIETESKYILWFKINKNLFHSYEDIIFGIVYVPPENSSYCIGDPFNEIEHELIKFSSDHENICLIGDFNSRTAEDLDFVEISDDEFSGMINIDNSIEVMLNELSISLHRCNMDKKKNYFGTLLLQLCKLNNMVICNGRIGDDKNIGKFTCKNTSVVDYAVCSSRFLKLIQNFSVLDTSKLISDIHCPLTLSIHGPGVIKNKKHGQENIESDEIMRSWDSEKTNVFIENINTARVDEVLNDLDSLPEVNSDSINAVIEKIGNILTDAAKSTFGSYSKNNRRNHENTSTS